MANQVGEVVECANCGQSHFIPQEQIDQWNREAAEAEGELVYPSSAWFTHQAREIYQDASDAGDLRTALQALQLLLRMNSC